MCGTSCGPGKEGIGGTSEGAFRSKLRAWMHRAAGTTQLQPEGTALAAKIGL